MQQGAIDLAWELLTDVYCIPRERLYVTYFGGNTALGLEPDLETKSIWASKGIPDVRRCQSWLMSANVRDQSLPV